MLTIIIGLISLGFIVVVHEFGHYYFAIKGGIKVDEFAIGLGPKIVSKTYKQTIWSLRILPLGGFCKMKSPDIMEISDKNSEIPQEAHSFSAASYRAKFLTLFGGPLANILLFILLSVFLYFLDDATSVDIRPYIEPIKLPAIDSELQSGDLIVSINDRPLSTFSELRETTQKLLGQEVIITYQRNSVIRSTTLRLNSEEPALGALPYISPTITFVEPESIAEQLGLKVGDIYTEVSATPITNAIQLPSLFYPDESYTLPIPFYIERNGKRIKYEIKPQRTYATLEQWGIQYPSIETKLWNSPSEYVTYRFKQFSNVYVGTIGFFADLIQFKTKKISNQVYGPIKIIQFVGSSTIDNAKSSGILSALVNLLNITALLSIAISALNLLPIPILDGGQLLFYSYFRLRNKKPKISSYIRYNSVGTVIMILLFIFVMFSDIRSFF